MKQGLTTLVPRKVVKADWEDNFGQLLTIVEPGFEGKVVDKILISSNERFADPAHQVEITAPLSVCDTFRCRFVCIFSAVFMFYYNSFVLFQFILRALLRHGSKVN